MTIHIVCQRITADRILPRLARYLRDNLGWTASNRPDPDATVNYFVAYGDGYHLYPHWRETPTAALFTHREEPGTGKAALWDMAASEVDLRVVIAKRYEPMLTPYGATVCVGLPIELDRFTIRPHKAGARPVVGVSGWVTRSTARSGRKGEALIARLAADDLGKRLDLRAAGVGWPIQLKGYAWEDMPTFYQSLDVYLCTSLNEGGPAGPLEALACGVPVVIPIGVGMMDELPNIPGIYRYPRGDYEGLRAALAAALQMPYLPAQLRATVGHWSVAAWCDAHRAAFRGWE